MQQRNHSMKNVWYFTVEDIHSLAQVRLSFISEKRYAFVIKSFSVTQVYLKLFNGNEKFLTPVKR